MATDSTLEETDASPDEGRDETGTRGTSNPPRPPRPGKRSKGSGRIPIPLPQSRPDFEAVEGDLNESAPAVSIDERDEPAIPLAASRRAKPASVPEESFADLDADLADAAPAAPVTPWRSVPKGPIDAGEVTPPRGSPLRFRSDDEELASQPEPTIVGKVNENLLELASNGGDENTRAFTAPRELIELAKRKREERVHGSGEDGSRITARPLNADDDVDLKVAAAPNVPLDSNPPAEVESDAAPPVAHSHASELAPHSRLAAARRFGPESGPEIEIDPASELSPSARRAVLASTGRNVPLTHDVPGSQPAASPRKLSQRNWLVLVGLFFAAGILISRWRELAALFH